MSDNTYLFIDGSNLYGSQFALFGPKKFLSFNDLITRLEKLLKISFDKIFFYASFSPIPKKPTKKQKLYLKNEALFYKNVRKTPKVDFFKGYRSPTSGKEKEVDVKLAVDMVDMAHRNKYQKMYYFPTYLVRFEDHDQIDLKQTTSPIKITINETVVKS